MEKGGGGKGGSSGLGTPTIDRHTAPRHPFPPVDLLAPGGTTGARDCLTGSKERAGRRGKAAEVWSSLSSNWASASCPRPEAKRHLQGSAWTQAPRLPSAPAPRGLYPALLHLSPQMHKPAFCAEDTTLLNKGQGSGGWGGRCQGQILGSIPSTFTDLLSISTTAP